MGRGVKHEGLKNSDGKVLVVTVVLEVTVKCQTKSVIFLFRWFVFYTKQSS